VTLFLLLPALARGAEPPAGPFDPSVYRERRERVMAEMKEGIAVLQSRGEDDREVYRQDSDFTYLTGVEERGAVLVLAPSERTYRHLLFLTPRDPEAERWTGDREPLGEELEKRTGFDKVHRTSRLESVLRGLLQRNKTLHVLNQPSLASQAVAPEQELHGKLVARTPGVSTGDLSDLLPRMRSIKEPRELERMQVAIDATLAAHRALARQLPQDVEENWLESVTAVELARAGAVRPAFPSMIGSGANSTVLHDPRHDRPVRAGDLVVVDIGALYGRHAADVIRTYPVSGRFTEEQRRGYELVLAAQQACIDMVRRGVFVEDLQRKAEGLLRAAGHGDHFHHGVSHFLGLDVHDAGRAAEPLKAGMVITVEPGVDIPEQDLGVHIEDDVLVTDDGHRLLSGALPRAPSAVEELMRREAGR
jgi:Xaa-Pro aminopeptidase